MGVALDEASADRAVQRAFAAVREAVESGVQPVSSEATLCFLFAWELGRALGFSSDYHIDFQWSAYSDLDTEDTFLDLLCWTDPDFKVAFEFKLPKRSAMKKGSNSTQTRAKICRDISRLSHLVRTGANAIRLGYFLAATDESAYTTEGAKSTNLQYRTYHGTVYTAGSVIEAGSRPNGIDRELLFPAHEVRFEWENIEERGGRTMPRKDGKLAWLKPIRIAG